MAQRSVHTSASFTCRYSALEGDGQFYVVCVACTTGLQKQGHGLRGYGQLVAFPRRCDASRMANILNAQGVYVR